eukprot:13292995-Heterocapsa_arctica.AAC.1
MDYPALRSMMINRLNMMIEQRRAALFHQRKLQQDANLAELAILQHKAHMIRCHMKVHEEFLAERFEFRDTAELSLFLAEGSAFHDETDLDPGSYTRATGTTPPTIDNLPPASRARHEDIYVWTGDMKAATNL